MTSEYRERPILFTNFGLFLWQARKSRGYSSGDMATYLGITAEEYRRIERGEEFPANQPLVKISDVLDIPLKKLKDLESADRRKQKEKVPMEGARLHSDNLNKDIELAKQSYTRCTGNELNRNQLSIFGQLKRDLYTVHIPLVLPINGLIILKAILRNEKKVKYLHEMLNFIPDESFAGFIARDAQWGPTALYIANLLFFHDNPATTVLDCCNRLTMNQFHIITHIILTQAGINTVESELAHLTKETEFAGLVLLFINELESYLPKDIDSNHLKLASLLEIHGTYILHELLLPSIKGHGEETLAENPKIYAGLDKTLFDVIAANLHPVVSAMVAANLKAPKEVQEILLNRRAIKAKDVSPACAILKMANFFVDNDFPKVSEEELKSLLETDYPNVAIPAKVLFQVCDKLKKLKAYLVQKSTVLSSQDKAVEKFVAKRNETTKEKAQLGMYSHWDEKRFDVRFEEGFLRAVTKSCLILADEHKDYMYSLHEGENLADYQERIGQLKLFAEYPFNQDLQILSQKFGVSSDEIKRRLKLK
ncbi:MAG TPA: hypothetical protein DDW49_08445 [Deltaproteobacteria bacterium]|nr:MAG: hypothetical protein A2048_05405 [Deltaproteobacteria bacterium GWA2_45_12]HBF13394.1 hypothetical protein [Deltaproteobacteria bacterium]